MKFAKLRDPRKYHGFFTPLIIGGISYYIPRMSYTKSGHTITLNLAVKIKSDYDFKITLPTLMKN
jgi:hypothetical protein